MYSDISAPPTSRTPHTVKTTLLLAACLCALLLAGFGSPAPISAQGKTTVQPATNEPLSGTDALLVQINAYRAEHGCAALVPNAQLAAAAQQHSEDMAIRNYLNHVNPEGLNFTDRITNTGYAWSKAAESIAVGLADPASVMQIWRSSPSHNASLLDCELVDVGIGYALQHDDQADVVFPDGSVGGPFFHYWTLTLARPQ